MSEIETCLIIGSAPDATQSTKWKKNLFSNIVAINNAWQIREDWDYLIYPDDFPIERHPITITQHQQVITSDKYVPIQNDFGGFVYAGGTMAFTAGYWAVGQLKPLVLGFIGCDMVYPPGKLTHFYGAGSADPLRDDVSLQSLQAKSNRFLYHALKHNCIPVNFSLNPISRLTYPNLGPAQLQSINWNVHSQAINLLLSRFDRIKVEAALALESKLGYYFKSGRYWEHLSDISKSAIKEVDTLWENAFIAEDDSVQICTTY